MAKGFYSLDTTTDVCPHCGSELVFAEYYSAVKGTSSVTAGQAGRKIIKTQYTDVQKCKGAYCMACLYKELALLLNIARAMVLVGLLGVVVCVILMLMKNNTIFWIPTLVFGLVLTLGWKWIGDDGVVGENPYTGLTKEQIHKQATARNDTMLDMSSNEFVANFPKDQIPEGRTLLPRNAFRD